jgi:hypothetical protein
VSELLSNDAETSCRIASTSRGITPSALGSRFASAHVSDVSGSLWPGGASEGQAWLRIMVEVPDLEPGRTKSHAVANYVRAAIKLQALRREFGNALVELRRCKAVLASRAQAESLMAEARALCEAFQIDPANQ